MTVSCIITCYNLERFIGSSIASVLGQTRLPDEIIVVDDASTDNSAAVIRQFGQKVVYLRMAQNSGVLQATLTGVKAATSEVISFLDGDDIWLPQKIEKAMAVFESEPDVILLSHNYEVIDDKGNRTVATDMTQQNLIRITAGNPDPQTLSDRIRDSILGYRGFWLGSAYCFRSDAFDIRAFEAFLDSFPLPDFKRLCYQDHPMAQYIILSNPQKRICLINEILFQYRLFGFNSSGVSNTVESALRTIQKGQANILATSTLVGAHPQLKAAIRRQAFMKKEFDFLKALYTRRYLAACMRFLELSFGTWTFGKRVKEFKRLVGVLALGPQKFLTLKTRKF